MPRFPESSAACLKRVMLSRSPGFMFYPMDVEAIMLETGLNKAQVQVWADHFRMRYETEKNRMEFLNADGFDKVRDHLPSLGPNFFWVPTAFPLNCLVLTGGIL
jgi:hypothetical protein